MIWGSAGFIIGIVLGSFVLALADRGLANKSFWGRSYCVQCKKRLRWYDLFPVLSFISTKGKCRYCHKKISWEYPLVEIVMGVLIGYLFFQTFGNFKFEIFNLNSNLEFKILNSLFDLIFKTFFITILSALFLTDLKKMLIPDRIVIPAIKISLIFLVVITVIRIGYLYYNLSQTPLGRLLLPPRNDYFINHAILDLQLLLLSVLMGILIAGFFTILIVITKGKGMGGGDVKLGGFMGLALGFPNALVALMVAFLSGAAVSLILIFSRKKHLGQVIPFGPFLVLGSLIALFWGDQILQIYLQLGR